MTRVRVYRIRHNALGLALPRHLVHKHGTSGAVAPTGTVGTPDWDQ